MTYGLREEHWEAERGNEERTNKKMWNVRTLSKQCRLWGEDTGKLAMGWSGWQGMNVNVKMSR